MMDRWTGGEMEEEADGERRGVMQEVKDEGWRKNGSHVCLLLQKIIVHFTQQTAPRCRLINYTTPLGHPETWRVFTLEF